VAFRYLLHDEDAENVGEFFTAVPNWRVGEEFLNGDGRRWRILAIETEIANELLERGFNGVFTVEPG
jgi:hypothetical protein